MIGRELGHYRIEAKLGEGGMGVVYKARDMHLDRPVAIKVLSAEAVSDPERKRRFVQEARTASALNHPNIIHIYDIDQSDGVDFMAMEFVEGKTLDQIGHEGLPLTQALRYASQIAGGLARAHEAGIVHRDIKPANIMVTAEGLVKVLDFGLAKLTEPLGESADLVLTQTVHTRTEPGVVFGTVQYMSPEQAEGKRVDGRSDIFSLGSVLYEMFTGRRPFPGDSKLAILSAILSKEPLPFRDVLKSPHPELDEIVRRCLQKDPDRRFQSMSELKAALDEVYEELRSPSTASRIRRAVRSTRRRRLWLAAAIAVAAALAVGIPLAWRASHAGAAGKLVAVLPFHNAADDPFTEGLERTLNRQLCSLNQFQPVERVLPPGDIYGVTTLGPGEARKKLGADLVLTGTAQHAPASVRLDFALVETGSGHEVRRLNLELPLSDPKVLEQGLVTKVAKLLDLRVTSQAEQSLAMGNTANPAAYTAWLTGYGHLQNADRAEDLDRAVAAFEDAIAKDPSYGLAHLALAEAFWAKSSLTQDKQWAEKARESCLRAVAAKADVAAVHLLMGKIYGGTGRPQEAIEEFRRALQLDPLSIDAHTNLGEAYAALGQLSDSEAAYRALVGLWPNYLVPYSYLASFYVQQGRYKDAEAPFRKVIELAPENASGYLNLGAVYHLLGRTDEAAEMMKKSLAIKPSARGYTNLGTLYFFEGHYSDAVPLMEKAVEMERSNYVYWGNLGDAYRWAPEDKSQAPDAYRQAIKLAEPNMNPNDADLRASLAGYYAKLPDPAKAMAEIGQARRLAPMNPRVLVKSALVYELAGKREQAISALDLALQSGYSLDEVRTDPEFAELRKDPRYARLEKAAAGKPAH